MTSSLKRGLRGAAEAGAALSMENHRANVQAKRDKALQQYQTGERLDEQAFRTSERLGAEKHDIAMKNLDSQIGGGGTQGDIQLMNYFQDHGIAKSPEDALRLVREMDTDPSKVIVDIAKSMHAANPDLPFDTHLKQAETDLGALRERLNPKPAEPQPQPSEGPVRGKGIINSGMSVDQGGMIDQALDSAPVKPAAGNIVETVKIQTDDDYHKLKPGTRYVAPDGKIREKK